MYRIDKKKLKELVELSLKEDIGAGDITTQISVSDDIQAIGKIIAKQDIVIAGIPVVKEVFSRIDKNLSVKILKDDGQKAAAGEYFLLIEGKANSLLKGERLALNFLQRLSAVATLTYKYVKAVKGTNAVILDTRKTTPGLRFLEKYAVSVGGGTNHRSGLYDQFLFKDNHIASSMKNFKNDIKNIVRKARDYKPDALVEVEVDTLSQLKDVIPAEPDIILLDNFSMDDLREAVKMKPENILFEASGEITLESVTQTAECGVDRISVGAITHSAQAVDISMDIELCRQKN
ncbi:carboxylating nicotinate-nucleotide diphosphorylase [bacterium]|nr:carboxylating nicotinate-nucleotide diphosphorylase [bacterium]